MKGIGASSPTNGDYDVRSNGNGSRFLDLTAESAVVGVIATGLFDKIPENKLDSAKGIL